MPNKPRIPSPNSPLVDPRKGVITRDWWRFQHDLWQQAGVTNFKVVVTQAEIAAGKQRILIDAAPGEQWQVTDIILSGAGDSFSGGSGDREIAITDGTSTWSVIPAATLQNLVASRWGVDVGMPNPVTPSHLFAISVSGTNIVAEYTGGATDYAVGSCTIMLLVERIA